MQCLRSICISGLHGGNGVNERLWQWVERGAQAQRGGGGVCGGAKTSAIQPSPEPVSRTFSSRLAPLLLPLSLSHPPPHPLRSSPHPSLSPLCFWGSWTKEATQCSRLCGSRKTLLLSAWQTINTFTVLTGKSQTTTVLFGHSGNDGKALNVVHAHTHTTPKSFFKGQNPQLLGLTCRFYRCLSHDLPMMHFICTWWVFNCIYNSIWNSCKHDCNAALSCSPFPLLFRVLLCTAHMQACTVIRFSLLRFVPPRELLSDCWATAIPADRGAKHLSFSFSLLSLCLELKRLLNSYLFFLQHLFSWTLDSRLTADLWFPTYVTDALLALILIHSMSSSLFFLYPLSLFSPLSFLFITCAPLCIVDGFPQNWPRLSLERADQQLSETLSEGRPQLKGMCAFSFVSLTL